MYRYETHLHTWPVSKCAKVSVEENLIFYKKLGFAGVFLTNHFVDGNLNMDKAAPFKDRVEFFYSDLDQARRLGAQMGIQVFGGVEMSFKHTDFLVYGPDKEWYLDHPEIMELEKHKFLPILREMGALVIQAHPFREGKALPFVRLYPRCIDGVEIYNACRTDFENHMAEVYAKEYGLLPFAGTDNHKGVNRATLGGMEGETPLADEWDFVRRVKAGEMRPFVMKNPLYVPPAAEV